MSEYTPPSKENDLRVGIWTTRALSLYSFSSVDRDAVPSYHQYQRADSSFLTEQLLALLTDSASSY
jgi:hypothetical protein